MECIQIYPDEYGEERCRGTGRLPAEAGRQMDPFQGKQPDKRNDREHGQVRAWYRSSESS